ncbi:hypothetical protein PCA31118_01009 [Pandoraea captiosa]|jgi:hypothetical protein|uniref:N-acyl amino acid synthase FeeM catalytic core domain-containing protein n=1 Tax=Pandoraea captiosa TaxID=2508302 RepID=A0A5E4ZQK9_9BURK|nr:hypothetical protein [Pandoraea captiosa]VVE62430.1 hypothetical protein PCA31118_01009 [Pandoraea captiosa]
MFDLAQASDVLSIPRAEFPSRNPHPAALPAAARAPVADLPQTTALREERLPFVITIASDESSLRDAVAMRQAAYGRHLPDLAATLSEPETSDREPGAIVLMARARLDGAVLGTMRIQTNRYQALHLEDSAPLPAWLDSAALAEATRLGVVAGPVGRVVKTALFKAFYQYCLLSGIDWMVITARPPLHRQYEALMFTDVFPGQDLIPMAHVGGIGHRVLALDVAQARTRWQSAGHPLFAYMCLTHHPDLRLGMPGQNAEEEAVSVAERGREVGPVPVEANVGAHLRDLSFSADEVRCVAAGFSLAV